MSALHDELRAIQAGLGGCGQGAAAAQLAAAAWRAALSALQLLVLNQAGFRPLTEPVRAGL